MMVEGLFDPTAQASIEAGVQDDLRHGGAEFFGKADRGRPVAALIAIFGQFDLRGFTTMIVLGPADADAMDHELHAIKPDLEIGESDDPTGFRRRGS